MRLAVMTLSAALAAFATAAAAQPGTTTNPPTERTMCIDISGRSLPPVCRAPASRLDQREDICVCHEGMRVTVPVCAPGEQAPPENTALMRARKDAARDGSLAGDLFEGKQICVAARNAH